MTEKIRREEGGEEVNRDERAEKTGRRESGADRDIKRERDDKRKDEEGEVFTLSFSTCRYKSFTALKRFFEKQLQQPASFTKDRLRPLVTKLLSIYEDKKMK